MYHSVAPDDAARYIEPGNRVDPRSFERQMAFLAAERRVLALSELMAEIAAGRTPPAGTVCITFDDGYRDHLTVAAPILERYRLPATLFLATGLVERGENQWSDTLHWLARKDLHAHLLEASHAERIACSINSSLRKGAAPVARLGRGARVRAALSALRDRRTYARPSRPSPAPRRGARADRGLRRGPAARARAMRGTSPIPTGAGTPRRARR